MTPGVGMVGELLALQRAHNEWRQNATPAERYASACAGLRHIAEVEDDAPAWYAEAGNAREKSDRAHHRAHGPLDSAE